MVSALNFLPNKQMKIVAFIILLFTSLLSLGQTISVQFPEYQFTSISNEIKIKTEDNSELKSIKVNGVDYSVNTIDNESIINYNYDASGSQDLVFKIGKTEIKETVSVIPLWLSILPPLIAIILALWLKEVIISLVLGIFLGAAVLGLYTEGLFGILTAFVHVLDSYIINSLNDWGHLSIILFTLIIGGMVAVISKNGGMQGVVNIITKKAHNAKNGQLATWFLGLAIFFDDYANTLVVGTTMRSITDKLKISREKLSYIVDSTAAPVAALAFITTWIGAELSYIESGMKDIPALMANETPYGIFISSLQYSFYPLFTIAFMFWLIWQQKDFGPMLKAERDARKGLAPTTEVKNTDLEEFNPKKGISSNWLLAFLPVLTVVIVTGIGLFSTGLESYTYDNSHGFFRNLSVIIGKADSFTALLWGSFASLFVAIILSVATKKLKLSESIESAVGGIKTMLPAIIILTLAWSLAEITNVMHTADFLTGLMKDNVSVYLIPSVTFILAALVSFSTGSSWGTMAILYPLLLPACWKLGIEASLPYEVLFGLFANTTACVLSGSVLGDHCSPISDTTILSSLATGCNHITHVRTQLPYAIVTGGIALFAGVLPTSYGLPSYVGFLFGLVLIYLTIKFIGKKVDYA